MFRLFFIIFLYLTLEVLEVPGLTLGPETGYSD
jgi:hypothetical protein